MDVFKPYKRNEDGTLRVSAYTKKRAEVWIAEMKLSMMRDYGERLARRIARRNAEGG